MNIKCPHCGTEYEAEESEIGRVVKCGVCGKEFVVVASFTKKFGEAATAMKNAAKNVANSVYEKARDIDWKAQGERAKAAAGAAYDKSKKICKSASEKYAAWGVPQRISHWWRSIMRFVSGFFMNRKMARFRHLLAASPWTIKFSTMYICALGMVLAVCNLLTAKPFASFVQSLIIVGITIAIVLTLVRFDAVRQLLVAWGGLNLILMLCGLRCFLFFWPFYFSCIAVAILLMTRSARQWYKVQTIVSNSDTNEFAFRRVVVIAAVVAVIMGAFHCVSYWQERSRRLESQRLAEEKAAEEAKQRAAEEAKQRQREEEKRRIVEEEREECRLARQRREERAAEILENAKAKRYEEMAREKWIELRYPEAADAYKKSRDRYNNWQKQMYRQGVW